MDIYVKKRRYNLYLIFTGSVLVLSAIVLAFLFLIPVLFPEPETGLAPDSLIVTSCGELLQSNSVYILGQDIVSPSGTCMTVSAVNVTIDGNGSSITGGGNGFGISATGIAYKVENITITGFEASLNGDGIFGTGDVGDISIHHSVLGKVDVSGGESTSEGGNAGDIYIEESIFTEIDAHGGLCSGTCSDTFIQGDGGDVTIVAGALDIQGRSIDVGGNTPGRLTLNYSDSLNDAGADYGNGLFLSLVRSISDGGTISWEEPISGQGLSGLSDNTNIDFNLAFADGIAIPGLDGSAVISLHGNPGAEFNVPEIIRDGQSCSESCTLLSSLDGETVIFNVTGFSTYRVGEKPLSLVSVDSCQDLAEPVTWYHLSDSFQADVVGHCFNVIADDVILDLQDNIISDTTPSSADVGVRVSNVSRTVVLNGGINGFGTGVLVLGSEDGRYEGLTVTSSDVPLGNVYGIRLEGSDGNVIGDNNISGLQMLGTVQMVQAVSLSDSHHNTIMNNMMNDNRGNTAGDGIILAASSHDNMIRDNFIQDNEMHGIQLINGPFGNTFLNNEIRGNGNTAIDDRTSDGTTFNELVYNNSGGEIRWIEPSFRDELTFNATLSLQSTAMLMFNHAELQTGSITADSGLLSGANITLYNSPADTDLMEHFIARDGIDCGEECHAYTSLTADTVRFNVSGWSVYSIEGVEPETLPVIDDGTDDDGDGDGGGGTTSFILSENSLDAEVITGEQEQESIIIENDGDNSIAISIEVIALTGIVTVNPSSFTLSPGETMPIVVDINASESIQAGIYSGSIQVSGSGITKQVSVVVDVNDAEELIDVDLTLKDDVVDKDDELEATVTLTDTGDVGFTEISLEYVIEQFGSDIEVILLQQTVPLDGTFTITRSFPVPSNLKSEEDYLFVIRAIQQGRVYSSVKTFNLTERTFRSAFEEVREVLTILVGIIVFTVLVVFIILIVKRKQIHEKHRIVAKARRTSGSLPELRER